MSASEAKERAEFKAWMAKYNRQYDSKDEEEHRFKIFQKTLQVVEAHNSDPRKTCTFGLNDFSDLTTEEFRSRCCGSTLTDSDSDIDDDKVVDDMPVKRQSHENVTKEDGTVTVSVKCQSHEKDTKEDAAVPTKSL